MEKEKLTPSQYFDKIKSLKKSSNDEMLDRFYDASLLMIEKYQKTGQKRMLDKVVFLLDVVPKERDLIKKGINVFVYKEDIESFINNIENKEVKIIEMKNYPREIPDELVSVVEDTKDIFDEFYILFTDYTGKEERRIAKERREKDPILFGVFKQNRSIHERFYYLGDWIDEYCDLTLEKLLEIEGENIAKTITTPINKMELVLEYQRLKESKSNNDSSIEASYTISGNTVDIKDVSNINLSKDDDRIC